MNRINRNIDSDDRWKQKRGSKSVVSFMRLCMCEAKLAELRSFGLDGTPHAARGPSVSFNDLVAYLYMYQLIVVAAT